METESLPKLRKSFEIFLHITPGQVDDTRFEKFLDYFQKFCRENTIHLFDEADGFTFLEKCVHHGDYRVVSTSLRLIGFIAGHRRGFLLIQEKKKQLLEYPLKYLKEDSVDQEALVRESSLKSLLQYLSQDEIDLQFEWIQSYFLFLVPKIFHLFQDGNNFIERAAVELLGRLIQVASMKNCLTELEQSGLNSHISGIFSLSEKKNASSSAEDVQLCILNLILNLLNHSHGENFIQQHQLLFKSMNCVMNKNRILRSRAIECVSVVCEQGKHNLFVSKNSEDDQVTEIEAFSLLKGKANELLKVKNRNNIFSMVEIFGALQFKTEKGKQNWKEFLDWMLQVLHCMIQANSDTSSLKSYLPNCDEQFFSSIKNFEQSFVTYTLQSFKQSIKTFSAELLKDSLFLDCIFGFFFHSKYHDAPKVQKECFELLNYVVEGNIHNQQNPDLVDNSQNILSNVLKRIVHESDRLVIDSALNTLLTCFKCKELREHFLLSSEFSGILKEILNELSGNWSWELRDSCINFIAYLFKEEDMISYCMKENFLKKVFTSISDKEMYVRSTAIQALKKISDFDIPFQETISNDTCLKNVMSLLEDTESLPKIETIRFFENLMEKEHSVDYIKRLVESDAFQFCSEFQKLYKDEDWEIRKECIHFLTQLILHHGVESFLALNGDTFFKQAITDHARLVRKEVAKSIQILKNTFDMTKRTSSTAEQFLQFMKDCPTELIIHESSTEKIYYENDEDYLFLDTQPVTDIDCYQ